jgi:hypothetical protein
MKAILQKTITCFFMMLLPFITSCRTEETEYIQAPEDEVLVANSAVASLMLKTSTNDGSKDNIIDKSNCFNINLPVTVTANGVSIVINSEEDYNIIEYLFDDDDSDNDTLSITFPITITLEDFTKVTVNSLSELNNYSNNCNGENEYDNDIECLDFQFPIIASLYNKNNEIIDIINIISDYDLFLFVKNLNAYDFVTINFPITVILFDNTELIINDLNELKNIIETHANDCDEDDDYDYNDDDCNMCNQEELITILTNCSDWTIDKLERYGYNYDNYYDNYTFNFSTDGTLSVYWDGITVTGTWTISGTAMNLEVIINVPSLPYCNNNWILHEISSYSETKIDLRVGNNDRMRYKNKCN